MPSGTGGKIEGRRGKERGKVREGRGGKVGEREGMEEGKREEGRKRRRK